MTTNVRPAQDHTLILTVTEPTGTPVDPATFDTIGALLTADEDDTIHLLDDPDDPDGLESAWNLDYFRVFAIAIDDTYYTAAGTLQRTAGTTEATHALLKDSMLDLENSPNRPTTRTSPTPNAAVTPTPAPHTGKPRNSSSGPC